VPTAGGCPPVPVNKPAGLTDERLRDWVTSGEGCEGVPPAVVSLSAQRRQSSQTAYPASTMMSIPATAR
jgi:hypothetical protein